MHTYTLHTYDICIHITHVGMDVYVNIPLGFALSRNGKNRSANSRLISFLFFIMSNNDVGGWYPVQLFAKLLVLVTSFI